MFFIISTLVFLQNTVKNSNSLISIISIAFITIMVLFTLNLYKVYKLKKKNSDLENELRTLKKELKVN